MKRLALHCFGSAQRCLSARQPLPLSPFSTHSTRLFATHSSAFPLSDLPPPPSPSPPANSHSSSPSSDSSLSSTTPPSPFHYANATSPPFSSFLIPDRHCSIVGVPFAGGQPLVGVDLGPNFIRKGGLSSRLLADQWKVVDCGDITVPAKVEGVEDSPLVKGAAVVGKVNELLYHATLPALLSQHFLLTLGGDHSIGIGSISAVLKRRPNIGVVWIDAHADINTPLTSVSKNPHGMVLSFLMNLHSSRATPGFRWMEAQSIPLLQAQDLVYIGLRDLDEGEKAIMRHYNIRAFSMHDVDKWGIGEVMRRAIDHLTRYEHRPLHLSLDIDSIDPAFAPSTGTRVSGGLSYREAYYVCEALSETGLLVSMDMVEVNPSLSSEEESAKTVQMAVGLIASAMGNKIL